MKHDPSQEGQARHKKTVVAAIPCFNEERFIGSVVLKTKRFVSSVIVIDDGSNDSTAEIAAEAGATVYQHRRNQGYGAAIRTAIKQGRELGADILVILDGDGQHDPKDIPKLIMPLLSGEADIVIGSRFLGKTTRPPFYRRVGQRILTAVTNVGSGQSVSDSQSGFRALSSRALNALHLTEDGMSVSSEIQFAVSKKELRLAEVPIDVSYMDQVKRNPVGHGVGVLSRVLVLFSLRQPLLLFGIPGLVLLGVGLGIGARVLAIYGDTHELAVGNSLGAILLCLAGLLSLFLALMLQAMKELMRGGIAQTLKEAERLMSGEEHNGEEN